MNKNSRDAFRAAVLIHERHAERDIPASIIHLPGYSWATIERLQRQIARAREHGWHQAARRLSEEMAEAIRRCHRDLETALRTVEAHSTSRVLRSPSEIYRDILALHAEFDEVEIDFDAHELRVTTDAIVLSDIDLGRFDIRLDWQRLGGPHPYRVVARDPNPSTAKSDVPHPHVQDETLCEGEGRAAIQAALAQCRQLCAACEESPCSGCLSCCPECEMDFCRGCMDVCPGRSRKICGSCLEDGLCPSYRAEQSQEEKDHDDGDKSIDPIEGQPAGRAGADIGPQEAHQTGSLAPADEETPNAAAEPDRLGEALVPA